MSGVYSFASLVGVCNIYNPDFPNFRKVYTSVTEDRNRVVRDLKYQAIRPVKVRGPLARAISGKRVTARMHQLEYLQRVGRKHLVQSQSDFDSPFRAKGNRARLAAITRLGDFCSAKKDIQLSKNYNTIGNKNRGFTQYLRA